MTKHPSKWKLEMMVGVGVCVQPDHIHSIVATEVFTLSSLYHHKETDDK